jgi:hypothetical protein
MKTVQNHQIIVHKLPQANTVDLGINPIDTILHMGMVTHLHRRYIQVLRSIVSTLHSTSHTVCNQLPAEANNIQGMGYSGKDMTSTKVGMGGLKRFPLCG